MLAERPDLHSQITKQNNPRQSYPALKLVSQPADSLSHHGEVPTDDEELTPTLENFVLTAPLKSKLPPSREMQFSSQETSVAS